MKKAPFKAGDKSLNVRRFLYACAFWTVAGDEELKPGEQQWLEQQFGEEGATSSLEEFVSLESDDFFDAFDSAADALSEEEKKDIYPRLEEWLYSCATADGTERTGERDVILKIKNRLSLETELRNLGIPRSAEPGAQSGPVESRVISARNHEIAGVEPQVSDYSAQGDEISIVRQGSHVLSGHDAEVTALDMSCDGKRVVSGSEDGSVRIWNWKDGSELMNEYAHEMGVMALRCSPKDARAVTGDRLGDVVAWDIENCQTLWKKQGKKKMNGGVTGIDISADGRKMCASLNTGMVTVWDFESGEPEHIEGKKKWGSINTVRFTPGGPGLISGGDDGMLRFWKTQNLEFDGLIEGHEAGITAIDISSDGKSLASAGRDNMVRIWNLEERKPVYELEGHNFSVYDVCFSRDDRFVASGAWDHTLRLWDVESGRQLLKMESIDGRFSSVAFDMETEFLLAGSSEKVVHVLNLQDKQK